MCKMQKKSGSYDKYLEIYLTYKDESNLIYNDDIKDPITTDALKIRGINKNIIDNMFSYNIKQSLNNNYKQTKLDCEILKKLSDDMNIQDFTNNQKDFAAAILWMRQNLSNNKIKIRIIAHGSPNMLQVQRSKTENFNININMIITLIHFIFTYNGSYIEDYCNSIETISFIGCKIGYGDNNILTQIRDYISTRLVIHNVRITGSSILNRFNAGCLEGIVEGEEDTYSRDSYKKNKKIYVS